MNLKVTPEPLPEPLRALLEDPPADLEELCERYTSHGRTFLAKHWGWCRTSVDGERVLRRRRLAPIDPGNGDLRWVRGRKTTRLAAVMAAAFGEREGWEVVPDWSVAPSGQRLLCITGASLQRQKTRSWTTGSLYAVDLPDASVTLVHGPDPIKDERLVQVVAVADDEALLLATRALRWFRRGTRRWEEVASLRVTDGIELGAGEVDGRRIAGARCGEHRRSLFVELTEDRIVPLGEVLRPASQVAVREGRALVRVGRRWHAVALPERRAAAPSRRSKAPPHPLIKVEVVPRRLLVDARPVAEALAPKIGRCELGPRSCGPGVAAGVGRGHLVVVRDGVARRIRAPANPRDFDVTADGATAFLLAAPPDASRELYVREVDGRGPWRAIEIDARGLTGPEAVAHLDVDHVVVRSTDALDLLRREGDRWMTTSRLKCPRASVLRALPGRDCVVLATTSGLCLYGRSGDQLKKLSEGRVPVLGAPVVWPEAFVTADGELHVNGWLIALRGAR